MLTLKCGNMRNPVVQDTPKVVIPNSTGPTKMPFAIIYETEVTFYGVDRRHRFAVFVIVAVIFARRC